MRDFGQIRSRYPIVALRVIDQTHIPHQVSNDFPLRLVEGVIVGAQIEINDEFIALAHEVFDEEDTWKAISVIPLGNVRGKVTLAEPVRE